MFESSRCATMSWAINLAKRRRKATEIVDSKQDDTQGRPVLEMHAPLTNQIIPGDTNFDNNNT